MPYEIHPDIAQAQTLPASFYADSALYERLLEGLFARSWQWIGDRDKLPEPAYLYPFELLPGSLAEPLLLSRSAQDEWFCLSNVCTHRANILCTEPGRQRLIRCGYHGRCFGADGRFRSMPEFEGVADFPSAKDDLPQLPLKALGKLLFTSLKSPIASFEKVFEPILARLAWFPWAELQARPHLDKDYEVEAHWALYCDNYLEGFHVPFVHPGLNERLDYGQYRTEVFEYCNLQLGLAEPGQPCFDLPTSALDYGQLVFAYYWWVFPNLMLNVYPWGLSLNLVEPQGLNRCRVKFRTFCLPGMTDAQVLASDTHQTELEDEVVVQQVQKGLRSRLYQGGRFSVAREACVHHFHRLLAAVAGSL